MIITRLRLSEVYPRLAANIVTLLDTDPLAATVGDLPYFGRCTCTPTCPTLLTAPQGAQGPAVRTLEREGVDVIWLGLDPGRTSIAGIEVLDDAELTTLR
ncbi:hypothetical protein [Acrocarpospora catenulata]|uniref:hypothetical protein n=1 Tax=Acrocarpospora catenulata TaxID=2836182 RepID=UPI001BDB05A4|nr:hypothetical protein [Acrocarpospora catenulata]